jgi:hypothetical protein
VNAIQAAYQVVHHGPLNVAALARLLKKSPTTLCHEVKPPAGSQAKLGLETAMRITEAQNDDRILLAWAAARGYRCVRVGAARELAHCNLLQAAARFTAEVGEALATERMVADGRITENEIAHFEREVADIAPAAIALAARMRAVAEEQARVRAAAPAMRRHAPPTIRAASAAASL